MTARRSGAWRVIGRTMLGGVVCAGAVLSYTWVTLPDVRVLEKSNPTSTAFMQIRAEEAARAGRHLRQRQSWVSFRSIATSLQKAVLIAEDEKFWQHDGIDYEELRVALRQDWASGTFARGASTLTQQLARNLYLRPDKTPTRKFEELLLTRRLEQQLSKTRIFELYLNLIEWGDGIWGAEAAARTYFGVSASELSPQQSALLAAAIINPRVNNPAHPGPGLLRRQEMILSRMR